MSFSSRAKCFLPSLDSQLLPSQIWSRDSERFLAQCLLQCLLFENDQGHLHTRTQTTRPPRARNDQTTNEESVHLSPSQASNMSKPFKGRLANRIFGPPFPPRTHSLPSGTPLPARGTGVATESSNVQRPAQAGPSHRRSNACQAPILWNEREEKSSRQQTEESEQAMAEILEQGINVRDSQIEVDKRWMLDGKSHDEMASIPLESR
jgi:hypothetical protein